MLDTADLEKQFFKSFPQVFWNDAITGLLAGYKEAQRSIAQAALDQPFATWDLPYHRRSIIETRVLSAAGRHTNKGIVATVEYAKNGGGPYTLLKSGPFQLTVSMVSGVELPRIADYRSDKSKFNNSLFAEYEDAEQRDTYYAVLAHQPHDGKDVPAAVSVKFPEADYTRAGHCIDLMDKFKMLFEVKPVQVEKILEPKPKLRGDAKRKRDDGTEGT